MLNHKKSASSSQQIRQRRLAEKEEQQREKEPIAPAPASDPVETPDPPKPPKAADSASSADLTPVLTIVQEKIEDLCQITGVTREQASIMLAHQVRLAPVHALVAKCLQEVADNFEDLPLREKVSMLDKIASTYQRLIPLERQSYGIPEAKNRVLDQYGDPFKEFLDELSDRVAKKVGAPSKDSNSTTTIDVEVIESDSDFSLPGDTFEEDMKNAEK